MLKNLIVNYFIYNFDERREMAHGDTSQNVGAL